MVEKNISDFEKLFIKGNFNVYLTSDTLNKIIIEGGENLVGGIVISQHNDTLEISNKNKCDFLRGANNRINIHLTFASLRNIAIEVPCNLKSTNNISVERLDIAVLTEIVDIDLALDCKSFGFWNVRSNGVLKLRGEVETCYIGVYGTFLLFAKDLIFKNGFIINDSEGDCHIDGGSALEVSLLNTGNIYYYTEPDDLIIKEISSTGQLISEVQ